MPSFYVARLNGRTAEQAVHAVVATFFTRAAPGKAARANGHDTFTETAYRVSRRKRGICEDALMIPEVSLVLCVQGPDHDRLLSRLLSLDTRLVGLDAYEIVIVGHGDPDDDGVVLRRIAEGSPHYRPVLHTPSCRSEKAVATGVRHARGGTIVLLAQATDDEASRVLALLRQQPGTVGDAKSNGNGPGPMLVTRELFSPAATREYAPLNAMLRRLAGAFQRWPFMPAKPATDTRYRSS